MKTNTTKVERIFKMLYRVLTRKILRPIGFSFYYLFVGLRFMWKIWWCTLVMQLATFVGVVLNIFWWHWWIWIESARPDGVGFPNFIPFLIFVVIGFVSLMRLIAAFVDDWECFMDCEHIGEGANWIGCTVTDFVEDIMKEDTELEKDKKYERRKGRKEFIKKNFVIITRRKKRRNEERNSYTRADIMDFED
jgi:hypothetical protein